MGGGENYVCTECGVIEQKDEKGNLPGKCPECGAIAAFQKAPGICAVEERFLGVD